MAQWYWMQDGQKQGPVDSEGLKERARTGKLKPTDTIWREGLLDWVRASQVKELFPAETTATAVYAGRGS